MVFSSPIFVFLFLPLVLAGYFAAGQRWKNVVLLLSSLIFYTWGESGYALVMVFLILMNWGAGIAIDRAAGPHRRRAILASAVALNLGVLIYFKYTNFILGNINDLFTARAGAAGAAPLANPPIHLPLGISFFTFHCLSYIVDIYRRVAPAQRSLTNFALYISFFPQLIAGPIIRYHDIAAQLIARSTNLDKFASGLERFTLGLGKKVLIANPLGSVADRIFALSAAELTTPVAWLGIASYSFQIYFDFSGYSDMAIGLGRMFGFEFLENFNYPYIAASIREFWRRWHISLSNWFREYLYIPLGGNRRGPWRTSFNLLTVFLLCGFWHGASWHFVVWGLIHGVFLAIERGPFGSLIDRLPRAVSHVYTLLVVMVAWVFFRTETLTEAFDFLSRMFAFHAPADSLWPIDAFLDRHIAGVLAAAAIGSTPALSWLARDWRARAGAVRGEYAKALPDGVRAASPAGNVLTVIRPVVMAMTLVLSVSYIAGHTYNPFIYFRF